MDTFKIRIDLEISNNKVPYNYEEALHAWIMQIVGDKTYGESFSDYVYTRINGVKPSEEDNGWVVVNNRPFILLRLTSREQLSNLFNILGNNDEIFEGVTVRSISPCGDDINSNIFFSSPSSPILVSKKYSRKDVLSSEELIDCEKYLMNSIKKKAEAFNFQLDDNFSIKILSQGHRSNYNYRNFRNKGRVLRLCINGNSDTKNFILTHGVGRGTGIGCGFIDTINNWR